MLRRNGTLLPRDRRIAGAAVIDERQALAFRILEVERHAPVALGQDAVPHVQFIEAADPPLERGRAVDAQAGAHDAARAAPLARRRPVEEREIGAGAALRIRIEQVIRAHIVLVHRSLDQAHAQHLRVEAMVLSDLCGNGGEVVDAEEIHPAILDHARERFGETRRVEALRDGLENPPVFDPPVARRLVFAICHADWGTVRPLRQSEHTQTFW